MALPKKKSRRGSQIGRLGLECKILKYDDSESHITYTIQLKCQSNESSWNISKRYNEFYRLNTELQKDRNFRGIKLPNFPGKAISFTDASKKELAEERMQHLEMYLNGLISRTVFLSSLAVRDFLMMPLSVRDLAVLLSTRQNAALKQGYMEKKGEINKKWRKRWFVLQPNYILKYYKEESSHNPQGSIDISTIIKVEMKNKRQNKKKHSFTLVAKQRRWFLACDNEAEKREWTRMFMRLRDTKAPLKSDNNLKSSPQITHRKSFNLGPHFKSITQVEWCPTIPGILATGSEDESVKLWQTHLIDHSLIPTHEEEEEEEEEEDEDEGKEKHQSTYPLAHIEFQPIAEYKTSGRVTCLEWSPDGSMLVVSLKKQNDNKYGYFIQCFDLQPILGLYTTDWDDFGGDGIHDKMNNDTKKAAANGDDASQVEEDDDSRTKIFTLQDHPSRLVFSSDGSFIYMAMDIDPNSEENEKRRPAFLVYLDLTQNQLHRCKTVDRIIDHQTEFIVDLAMNNARNVMTVATSTHQNKGRLIAWDVEKNETRIIERNGTRISSLLFTHDDLWLIIGRNNGKLEFWNKCKHNEVENESSNENNSNNDDDNDNDNEIDILFEMKYEDNMHSGPVFHLTTSNGILISSATASNLEHESFFVDNVMYDLRSLINCGTKGKIISRLHNVNEVSSNITRLLQLAPVTPRHIREGGGPGTLLAASGDHAVYCHSLVDVLLDALSMSHS